MGIKRKSTLDALARSYIPYLLTTRTYINIYPDVNANGTCQTLHKNDSESKSHNLKHVYTPVVYICINISIS